jgi:hypothetical protein
MKFATMLTAAAVTALAQARQISEYARKRVT